jgi:hypothetical protein
MADFAVRHARKNFPLMVAKRHSSSRLPVAVAINRNNNTCTHKGFLRTVLHHVIQRPTRWRDFDEYQWIPICRSRDFFNPLILKCLTWSILRLKFYGISGWESQKAGINPQTAIESIGESWHHLRFNAAIPWRPTDSILMGSCGDFFCWSFPVPAPVRKNRAVGLVDKL